MINFMNDYNSPGHPAVLKAVAEASQNKYPGYACDEVCERAKKKIIMRLGQKREADIHFLTGGTQANLTAIGAFLRPHEAVIAADSAHIQVHETGAIEAAGHKILLESWRRPPVTGKSPAVSSGEPSAQADGKLSADDVSRLYRLHSDEHMVKPRLVYISQSTELGGVYSFRELAELRTVCHEYNLLLYMDGARLAAALVSDANDALLPDVAELCDAFYIGGTKNGLMFGEAMVIMNNSLKEDFRYHQKQRGGLLAKGFLLGLQFDAIFEDDLYFKIAAHADRMACRLKTGFEKQGVRFFVDSHTNQLFPILSNGTINGLAGGFLFETWQEVDETHTAVRFVTSWNTTEEEVDALLGACAANAVM